MTFMRYDLTQLVSLNHLLRRIDQTVSFKMIAQRYRELVKQTGRKGYGVEVGIKSLYLQFHYDLPDRGMEERLRDDMAFRWFCGLNLEEETPDHTYFCRIRQVLGTKRIGEIFSRIVQKAKDKGTQTYLPASRNGFCG